MDRLEQKSTTPISEEPIFSRIKESLAKATAETQSYIAQIQSKVAILGVHPLETSKATANDHHTAKTPVRDPNPSVASDLWDLHNTMRSNVEHLHLINEALTKLVGG